MVCTTAGTPSAQAAARAHDAGLRAMGVDDLGLKPANRLPQLPIGCPIRHRPDGPNQLGHHLDLEVLPPRPLEQVAFGSLRRPGDQRHVVSIAMMQALNREQGVFLSTTKNQSSDNMYNFHQ